ncbi:MAG: DUF4147 domain-containing protein [bacterium]|nr:DUF4147 domain-containing protein [bacterium]
MGKIKNTKELATTGLREAALGIAEAGFTAIDTASVIRRTVSVEVGTPAWPAGRLTVAGHAYDLQKVRRLYVIGVGKCASAAVVALEEVLGSRIAGGVMIDVKYDGGLSFVRGFEGDHPFPSRRNASATRELVRLLSDATAEDLVLAVISGGGSTLLCLPDDDRWCDDEARLVKLLFKSGADIRELNTVRKHLSRARGGFLAAHAYPAPLVSLIFSDVPGDDLEFVSSGPTVLDTTTVADARAILTRYRVAEQCPDVAGRLIETPKEQRFFERTTNLLAVSNGTALDAMAAEAARRGFSPEVRARAFAGEARDLALIFLGELHASPPGAALLYGGESTVTVMHDGKGGRNQELALSGLRDIRDGELLLALATDGRDNTDYAGGICDTITLDHARVHGLDIERSLDGNESYRFFAESGDAVVTGETGSNVSDIILALKANHPATP